jgi:hypothetical protein
VNAIKTTKCIVTDATALGFTAIPCFGFLPQQLAFCVVSLLKRDRLGTRSNNIITSFVKTEERSINFIYGNRIQRKSVITFTPSS